MTYREYRRLVKEQPTDWLKLCHDNPTQYMRKAHLSIIKSVIIKRTKNRR